MRSIPIPPRAAVSFAALLIGGLLTGLLLAVRPSISLREINPSRNLPDSLNVERITQLQTEVQQLNNELTQLRDEQNRLQKDTASSQGDLGSIQTNIDSERQTAALTALRGPGVTVTLDDSSSIFEQETDVNRYIIHQQQLVTLVGVLWNADAEAIAINEQRITDQTSIYCVGSTILINQQLMAPPFTIRAIGDPTALENAVTKSPMLADLWSRQREYGIEVSVKAKNQIQVPGYNGAFADSNLEVQQ